MKKAFKVIVRDGAIKSPVQLGFKKDAWTVAWENSSKDAEGESLHEAGLAIYTVLSEIRDELKKWNSSHAPAVSNGELLRYFAALPNRDRFITTRLFREPQDGKKSVFGMTTANNAVGNELSLMEVAEGSADGVQKAALACVFRMANGLPAIAGSEPLDLIEFLKGEANFSQLYGFYEGYWNALVWGDYRFNWVDKGSNLAEIFQEKTVSEVAFELSQIRRTRLSLNSLNAAMPIYRLFEDKYILLRGRGRQRRYCVENIKRAPESLRVSNAIFLINMSELPEVLPESFLEKKYLTVGVSVLEMLEIFRNLHLFSLSVSEKFPENDAIDVAEDLLAYSPKVDLRKLGRSVSIATGFSFEKIVAVFDFLTYENQNDDIWCHPFLRLDDRNAALIIPAFASPNLLRVVEHWLVKLDVDLSEKGYLYEGNVVSQINAALSANHLVNDYDPAVNKRVQLVSGAEEEIDLILRVGSSVIVGEAKSIVSTDSPISYFRARQILEKAAVQAQRKTQFVKDNLVEAFERFGIAYDAKKEYNFHPVIINSNRMHVGFPVQGVPVCDELTLVAYFKKGEFPLFSVFENKKPKHLAWLEVYNSSETLEKNIGLYLNNLPQVHDGTDDFELKDTRLPILSDTSLKLIYRRLLPKEVTLQQRLSRKYVFPLHTVENINDELARVDFVI